MEAFFYGPDKTKGGSAGTTTSPDFPLSHALQTQIFPSGTLNGVPSEAALS
jgi:hypothetical protein